MARISRNFFSLHVGWLYILTVVLLFSSVALFLFSLYKSAAPSPGFNSVAEFFAEFPMYFHSNNGAFEDGVKYYSKGYQYDLLFKNHAVLLNLYADDAVNENNIGNENNVDNPLGGDTQHENGVNVSQLGVMFVASNAETGITGVHPTHVEKPGRGDAGRPAVAGGNAGSNASYNAGNKAGSNASNNLSLEATTFLELKYSNVFPGIDVYFHGKQKQLYYDFVLARDANTSAMRVKIFGAGNSNVSFDVHGNISVDCNGRKMLIKKPNVYRITDYGKRLVDGYFFVTRNNELRFKTTEHASG